MQISLNFPSESYVEVDVKTLTSLASLKLDVGVSVRTRSGRERTHKRSFRRIHIEAVDVKAVNVFEVKEKGRGLRGG